MNPCERETPPPHPVRNHHYRNHTTEAETRRELLDLISELEGGDPTDPGHDRGRGRSPTRRSNPICSRIAYHQRACRRRERQARAEREDQPRQEQPQEQSRRERLRQDQLQQTLLLATQQQQHQILLLMTQQQQIQQEIAVLLRKHLQDP